MHFAISNRKLERRHSWPMAARKAKAFKRLDDLDVKVKYCTVVVVFRRFPLGPVK